MNLLMILLVSGLDLYLMPDKLELPESSELLIKNAESKAIAAALNYNCYAMRR